MAESTANTKREWSRTVGAIAVIVLMLLMFVGFVMLFGAVRGEEFSATTFSRRSFVFYRIPVLKIQVTPVVRSSTTNALEAHLTTNLFPAVESLAVESPPVESDQQHGDDEDNDKQRSRAKAAAQRWDIVRLTPLSRPSEFGSAYCLCAYLDREQGGKLKWLSWTKAHPKLAQALWPVVRQAAMDRRYFCVPDLMTAAEQAANLGTDPDALKKELGQIANQAATLHDAAVNTTGKGPHETD